MVCSGMWGRLKRERTLHLPLHTCDSCARGQTLYQCLVEEEAGIFTVITPHPPTHPSIQDIVHRAARHRPPLCQELCLSIYVREQVSVEVAGVNAALIVKDVYASLARMSLMDIL